MQRSGGNSDGCAARGCVAMIEKTNAFLALSTLIPAILEELSVISGHQGHHHSYCPQDSDHPASWDSLSDHSSLL